MGLLDWLRGKAPAEPKPTAGYTFVARLNMRVMPVDRGAVFEDPLDDFLRQHGLGEVTGGGTTMAADPDGIASCDVEMRLQSANAATTNQIIGFLDTLGAPRGSVLRIATATDGQCFGQTEGLGLFLNGTDLQAAVYAGSDLNAVIDTCAKAMGQTGRLRGSWRGARETALYFYGPSYQSMQTTLADLIPSIPLCEKARLVQIA